MNPLPWLEGFKSLNQSHCTGSSSSLIWTVTAQCTGQVWCDTWLIREKRAGLANCLTADRVWQCHVTWRVSGSGKVSPHLWSLEPRPQHWPGLSLFQLSSLQTLHHHYHYWIQKLSCLHNPNNASHHPLIWSLDAAANCSGWSGYSWVLICPFRKLSYAYNIVHCSLFVVSMLIIKACVCVCVSQDKKCNQSARDTVWNGAIPMAEFSLKPKKSWSGVGLVE